MAEGDNGKHEAMEGGPPKPLATIMITLNADKTVGVSFPNDEIITRFLLDKGSDSIREELRKRNAPLITPAGGASLPHARNFLGGIRPNLG